ncbi:DUF5908 family protein [Undibacterium sp. SXout7W]|uniref:DUF5908 family protein n=1 Tax=Undibacterium sp. SXout7W TaxID=3413049 RepID=UPI003BF2200C
MTIEIRELVIRATVTPSQVKPALSPQIIEEIKQQIIRECNDRILENLQSSLQR